MTIKIELTKGLTALIDDIDSDLADFKWCVTASGNEYYAYGRLAKGGKQLLMHRVILERVIGRSLTKTELTDHINMNKLDNRRENLRIATHSQNGQNQGLRPDNTSGFKGVSWYKKTSKWTASIYIYGRRKYLGYFDTPELAHAAYCKAAKELHGEFARFE